MRTIPKKLIMGMSNLACDKCHKQIPLDEIVGTLEIGSMTNDPLQDTHFCRRCQNKSFESCFEIAGNKGGTGLGKELTH
jgi:hypothetical protein